ncbi:MAG: sporulation integral membrane protein YtvI [Clostridia bacterium]|nr:sporulation integral membrane protein YtvI [Clostridia bacterium]
MNLEEKKKFIINFIYFSFWTAIIYLLFRVALFYLLPFLMGLVIACTVQKPGIYFSKKFKIKREFCAAFLAVVCFVFVVGVVSFLAWIMYTQFSELLNDLSGYSNTLIGFFENFYNILRDSLSKLSEGLRGTLNDFSKNTINDIISKISMFLSSVLTGFIKKIPTIFISIVVTIVATCYISKDYNKLSLFFRGIINEENYKKTIELKNILKECFLKFIVGYFWLFVITFLQLTFGFIILGINHFFVLAFLVAFLDILPIIGTGTILIPWAIIMFFQEKYTLGIGLIILLISIVLVRNFAEPKIIGKQTGINPLFTLIFVFVGLRFGGVFGMLILPITLTVLFTFYRRQYTENTLK